MSNLTRYGQTALDKTFPDADESVFGHMVLELGMSPDEATQNLRPWVRDLDRSAQLSKKTAYMAAFIGAGAGLATAATMGIGLTAILPIAAAAYNFFAGQQSAREQGVRESEYLLLKTCPELLKLIYALTQKGMPKEALVECYDDLLGAFMMQFQQRASLGMSDELDHDIVRSFQEIVKQKCEAESLARAIVAETENFTFDTLYQSTEPKPESLPAAPIATASPIGTATKLGAALVPASPAATSPALFNPAIDLGQNPQSALIVGTPGSGKGMLVSNAVRVLHEKAPALKVMMIDPKGDPKEKGYWSPVVDVYRSMNLMDCDDPDEGASWLLSGMDEFRKLAAPKLLIFDEMLAASVEISLAHKDFKAPQRLKKFVSGIIAQGDSQGVWVWAMSQSVQVADLGFGGGVRGNLRAIALISPKNTTAIEALTSTRLVPPPTGGMDELRAIMKASPVDRAFYDGKLSRWLPMPKLENHSGFDRDNRTIEAEPTVSKDETANPQEKPAESPIQADEPEDDAPEIGLNQPSVAEVKAQKKELFELGQAILELLQKNPDKSYSDEAIRTNRFIETTTGKRPSLITVRASISAVSKLHYVSVDSEGKIQWNQPS
jgi:hypothetical protein